MLARKLGTACVVAMTLAACGTLRPATADGACRALGSDLVGAKGATPRDQYKIDSTLEALVSIGCVTRKQAAGLQ